MNSWEADGKARWALRGLQDYERELEPDLQNPLPNLPRYQIQERLGAGATSVVYRAWDRQLQRPVALKVLREAAGWSSLARQRFDREARIMAGLAHENVLTVHDAGELEGAQYLVMELVEGRPLTASMGPKPAPQEELIRLLEKVARGMAAAHARGIVHRDLKPANILVASSGEPKVGDFGLAHIVDARADLTRTGVAVGTPLYMAPEQVDGREVTPRTDVYALGAILYQIATGRPPHAGESVAEIYGKISRDDPPPPRRLNRRLPRDLEAIILKALEKDPERRYPDADALAEDLGRYRAGEPVQAKPIAPAVRWWRRLQKHRPVLVSSAAAALLGGLVVTAFIKASGPPVIAAPAEPAPPAPPEPGLLAHWGMDEGRGQTLADSTGPGHIGALMNGAAWSAGKTGGGLRFDGKDDYVALPPLDLGDAFSIALWARLESEGLQTHMLLTNSAGGYEQDGFRLFVNSTRTNDRKAYFETGNGREGRSVFTPRDAFLSEDWHHVAVVVERSRGRAGLYLDGREVGIEPHIRKDFKTGGALYLGRLRNGGSALRGCLDDVRIYSRLLTEQEIYRLASGGR